MHAPALVLFDIDGTLIRRAGPHHRQALVEAVRKVTGLESTTDDIPVQGMLDPNILAIMMKSAGATMWERPWTRGRSIGRCTSNAIPNSPDWPKIPT